ncbi:MOSC N-terminal beta barrel domain-containing protein [Crepidotus variabilis]|uniref:MOSC N-terminal beta barrel domain-containing protein n=1 Tax=Crepidotus variabilis TaxID=179855 RepID=A0A9P6JTN7_9AGAR|nr:MOSC N-terminal beta barrel domain-containing protein [Crepidotus variabilis]
MVQLPYASGFFWTALTSRHELLVTNTACWALVAAIIPIFAIYFTIWKPSRLSRVKSSGIRTLASSSTMESSPIIKRSPPKPGVITVSKILIHPIKSCKGLSVESVNYTHEGLENDRLWCVIDATKRTVITARESPKMVLILPTVKSDGTLRVSFPNDSGCEPFSVPLNPDEEVMRTWESIPDLKLWSTPIDGYISEAISGPKGTASAILSKYFEKPVHLLFKGPEPRIVEPTAAFPDLAATSKYQDMYPMLILSEESTIEVEKQLRGYVGTQGIEERWKSDSIVIERFRPNIVVKGGGPFAEDEWEEISIGDPGSAPRITLVSKCTRCLLPNVDPATGEKDKAVPFKVLMKFRTGLDPKHKMKACVGCNAVPSGNGTLRVGDIVHVRKMI